MMNMDIMRCIRLLLIVCIVIFGLFGIGMFALGIVVATIESSAAEVADKAAHVNTFGGLMITVGILAVSIAFVGFYGTWRENRMCLILYAAIVAVVFMLEVIVGSLAVHYRDKLKDNLERGMYKTLAKASTGSHIFKMWNKVQKKLKCCGVSNYSDWQRNDTAWQRENHTSTEFPYSCCGGYSSSDTCSSDSFTFFSSKGCYNSIYDNLQSSWRSLAAVAITIGILQLAGVLFACLYQKHLLNKKGYKEV